MKKISVIEISKWLANVGMASASINDSWRLWLNGVIFVAKYRRNVVMAAGLRRINGVSSMKANIWPSSANGQRGG
jgi:hypothetical protein